MNWQPIETCPIDRDDVLLWTPSGQLVGYTYDRKRWYASGVKASDEGCDVELFEPPTHWMPTPPDPLPDDARAELYGVVEQILDSGHMNTEDLARLRAAYGRAN